MSVLPVGVFVVVLPYHGDTSHHVSTVESFAGGLHGYFDFDPLLLMLLLDSTVHHSIPKINLPVLKIKKQKEKTVIHL